MADQVEGVNEGRAYLIHLIYDFIFLLLIVLTSPYIVFRLATSARFRAGIVQRIGFVRRSPFRGRCIWVHGVSAGEVKAIQPLLLKMEEEEGPLAWAISTTTLAGYQMAGKLFPDKFIFYFPLDISFIVRRVIRRIRPGLIILMELEIWPNLLYEANSAGSSVIIVNGRISERSYRGYRRIRMFLPEMNRISLFSVQNEEYRRRLLALEVPEERLMVTGNIKFDGLDISESVDQALLRDQLRIGADDRVLVAGSTHHGEDEILLGLYRRLSGVDPDLRLVLVPRHLERIPDIEKACHKHGLAPVRRTRLKPDRSPIGKEEVLLVDTIGELEMVYGAAHMVFVGGSLVEVGGHNMLEPAGKGKAVLYGPHVQNFTEEAMLLERNNAALRVSDGASLENAVRELIDNPDKALELGQRAREAVRSARGAAATNVKLIRTRFLQKARIEL